MRIAGWLLLAAAIPRMLSADDAVMRTSAPDVAPGTAGLGVGFRVSDSPLVSGRGGPDLVPLYLYSGRRLFSHGTSVGVHLVSLDAWRVDALARYRFWRLDPADDEAFTGMTERRQTFDGGIVATRRRGRNEWSLEWLEDLLDRHGGRDLGFGYRARFELGHWSLSPYLKFNWLDDELAGYYFGVREDEARDSRPAYRPGRAFNLGYGIGTSYRIGPSAELFANLGVIEHDSVIFDSPLVDQALDVSTFIGFNHYFGNVYEPRVTAGERESEWSWRINYGYQAQGNIVGDIDQGDFRRSFDAETRLAGLTISKLLGGGPRVDFYGRLAVFRHVEGSAQQDFFSTAAYVMAMGRGFLPWSEQPAFRWGFGLGFSYAQRVPIVEQIKQTRNDQKMTRLLNYLEMTVDFPVRRLFDSATAKSCFAGLTVVHRSGVFATSSFLGDVAGGSDWITFHLECLR